MRSAQIVPVGLFSASALFMLTTALEAFKGQPVKPVFLVLAVVFAVLGGVFQMRSRASR